MRIIDGTGTRTGACSNALIGARHTARSCEHSRGNPSLDRSGHADALLRQLGRGNGGDPAGKFVEETVGQQHRTASAPVEGENAGHSGVEIRVQIREQKALLSLAKIGRVGVGEVGATQLIVIRTQVAEEVDLLEGSAQPARGGA